MLSQQREEISVDQRSPIIEAEVERKVSATGNQGTYGTHGGKHSPGQHKVGNHTGTGSNVRHEHEQSKTYPYRGSGHSEEDVDMNMSSSETKNAVMRVARTEHKRLGRVGSELAAEFEAFVSAQTLKNDSLPWVESQKVAKELLGLQEHFTQEELSELKHHADGRRLEVLTIERLIGEKLGMGLNIQHTQEENSLTQTVQIKTVQEGGVADRATGGSSGMVVGDEILAVSNQILKNRPYLDTVQILSNLPLRVKVVVARAEEDSEDDDSMGQDSRESESNSSGRSSCGDNRFQEEDIWKRIENTRVDNVLGVYLSPKNSHLQINEKTKHTWDNKSEDIWQKVEGKQNSNVYLKKENIRANFVNDVKSLQHSSRLSPTHKKHKQQLKFRSRSPSPRTPALGEDTLSRDSSPTVSFSMDVTDENEDDLEDLLMLETEPLSEQEEDDDDGNDREEKSVYYTPQESQNASNLKFMKSLKVDLDDSLYQTPSENFGSKDTLDEGLGGNDPPVTDIDDLLASDDGYMETEESDLRNSPPNSTKGNKSQVAGSPRYEQRRARHHLRNDAKGIVKSSPVISSMKQKMEITVSKEAPVVSTSPPPVQTPSPRTSPTRSTPSPQSSKERSPVKSPDSLNSNEPESVVKRDKKELSGVSRRYRSSRVDKDVFKQRRNMFEAASKDAAPLPLPVNKPKTPSTAQTKSKLSAISPETPTAPSVQANVSSSKSSSTHNVISRSATPKANDIPASEQVSMQSNADVAKPESPKNGQDQEVFGADIRAMSSVASSMERLNEAKSPEPANPLASAVDHIFASVMDDALEDTSNEGLYLGETSQTDISVSSDTKMDMPVMRPPTGFRDDSSLEPSQSHLEDLDSDDDVDDDDNIPDNIADESDSEEDLSGSSSSSGGSNGRRDTFDCQPNWDHRKGTVIKVVSPVVARSKAMSPPTVAKKLLKADALNFNSDSSDDEQETPKGPIILPLPANLLEKQIKSKAVKKEVTPAVSSAEKAFQGQDDHSSEKGDSPRNNVEHTDSLTSDETPMSPRLPPDGHEFPEQIPKCSSPASSNNAGTSPKDSSTVQKITSPDSSTSPVVPESSVVARASPEQSTPSAKPSLPKKPDLSMLALSSKSPVSPTAPTAKMSLASLSSQSQNKTQPTFFKDVKLKSPPKVGSDDVFTSPRTSPKLGSPKFGLNRWGSREKSDGDEDIVARRGALFGEVIKRRTSSSSSSTTSSPPPTPARTPSPTHIPRSKSDGGNKVESSPGQRDHDSLSSTISSEIDEVDLENDQSSPPLPGNPPTDAQKTENSKFANTDSFNEGSDNDVDSSDGVNSSECATVKNPELTTKPTPSSETAVVPSKSDALKTQNKDSTAAKESKTPSVAPVSKETSLLSRLGNTGTTRSVAPPLKPSPSAIKPSILDSMNTVSSPNQKLKGLSVPKKLTSATSPGSSIQAGQPKVGVPLLSSTKPKQMLLPTRGTPATTASAGALSIGLKSKLNARRFSWEAEKMQSLTGNENKTVGPVSNLNKTESGGKLESADGTKRTNPPLNSASRAAMSSSLSRLRLELKSAAAKKETEETKQSSEDTSTVSTLSPDINSNVRDDITKPKLPTKPVLTRRNPSDRTLSKSNKRVSFEGDERIMQVLDSKIDSVPSQSTIKGEPGNTMEDANDAHKVGSGSLSPAGPSEMDSQAKDGESDEDAPPPLPASSPPKQETPPKNPLLVKPNSLPLNLSSSGSPSGKSAPPVPSSPKPPLPSSKPPVTSRSPKSGVTKSVTPIIVSDADVHDDDDYDEEETLDDLGEEKQKLSPVLPQKLPPSPSMPWVKSPIYDVSADILSSLDPEEGVLEIRVSSSSFFFTIKLKNKRILFHSIFRFNNV